MWLGMRTQTVDAATGRGEDTTGAPVPHPSRRPLPTLRAGCIRSPGLRAGLPGDV